MSSRAIRALRGDLALSDIPSTVAEREDDDDDDDESSDEQVVQRRPAAFAMINDDDDDDDSSSSSSNNEEEDGLETKNDSKKEEKAKPSAANSDVVVAAVEEDAQDEDLDALLSEFHEKDNSKPLMKDDQIQIIGLETSPFDLILASLDTRDLDYEYSMRTSILLNSGGESSSSSSSNQQQRQRKAPLFGPPKDGWIRPPRLVGCGIGMTTYDNADTILSKPRSVPWPYTNNNDDTTNAEGVVETPPPSSTSHQWCTFVHSDNYERDLRDYTTVIQQSGDLDSLVMFVAHHPYVTAALLQLTTVLYQTNHSQEGLALLRRCLWVYESSALASFHNQISSSKVVFMDKEQPENAVFFQALFRLVQVSHIAG